MSGQRRVSRGSWFRQADDIGLQRRLILDKSLKPHEREALMNWHWEIWGRDEQLPPASEWRVWLICAGRGFGKTRAGAEWVRMVARFDSAARIALVGASLGEVRGVMVEGESGVLAAAPGALLPEYEPSLRRLVWPNGAQAFLYAAGEPESLRGPQHCHAWCDEIAKWDNASGRALAAWDNLQLGMRLGEQPRLLATSTPRNVPLMTRLLREAEAGDVVVARGRTGDNAGVLPTAYYDAMLSQFSQTTLGRQELEGELIGDVDGPLWNRALIEACREPAASSRAVRTVIGVDPPASASGDACGIVVCALGEDGIARVLADCSVEKASPERWARAVANAAHQWQADRVVAESNQGGAMVASVLRAAEHNLPLKLVHARLGKSARAEPVAALYEAGRVRHADQFPAPCSPNTSRRCDGWSGPTARTPFSMPRANLNRCGDRKMATLAGQAQKEGFINEVAARIEALLGLAIEAEQANVPAAPLDGQSWLIASNPTGAWLGKAGQIASRQAGNWLFTMPVDGMRLLNRATGQHQCYRSGWQNPVKPAAPTGGTVVDIEARAAIVALISALTAAGIFASP